MSVKKYCIFRATVGSDTYHFKIFSQPWTNTEQVSSVEGPKEASAEILYF